MSLNNSGFSGTARKKNGFLYTMSWFWNVGNKFVKNFSNLVLELDLDPKQVTFTFDYRKFTAWYNGKKKKNSCGRFHFVWYSQQMKTQ